MSICSNFYFTLPARNVTESSFHCICQWNHRSLAVSHFTTKFHKIRISNKHVLLTTAQSLLSLLHSGFISTPALTQLLHWPQRALLWLHSQNPRHSPQALPLDTQTAGYSNNAPPPAMEKWCRSVHEPHVHCVEWKKPNSKTTTGYVHHMWHSCKDHMDREQTWGGQDWVWGCLQGHSGVGWGRTEVLMEVVYILMEWCSTSVDTCQRHKTDHLKVLIFPCANYIPSTSSHQASQMLQKNAAAWPSVLTLLSSCSPAYQLPQPTRWWTDNLPRWLPCTRESCMKSCLDVGAMPVMRATQGYPSPLSSWMEHIAVSYRLGKKH